jgi:hypothetical protein
MKKLLLLTLALSLPLAQSVRADNNNDRKKHRHEAEVAAAQRAEAAKHSAATHAVQRSARQPARQVQSHAPQTRRAISPQQVNRANSGRTVDRHVGSYRGHAPANVQNNNVATVNRHNHNGQVTVQRNHTNRNFDRNSYSVARSRLVHGRHDHNWWRRHYGHTRFVLFGGGYYYWDAGYWYPAYGYSPIYNTYAYDGPIYGYNDLAPGQVLENVQLALRDLGYYRGPIDGLIGPQTRAALAAFQRDNGLVETAAVDEPTLVTLGLA